MIEAKEELRSSEREIRCCSSVCDVQSIRGLYICIRGKWATDEDEERLEKVDTKRQWRGKCREVAPSLA